MDDKESFSREIFLSDRSHCEQLIPAIDQLLNECHISLSDIDFFAASVGPGSFTGIRIGLATVKAFALAKNKKVIGVSSLEAMTQSNPDYSGLICSMVSAGRGQFYAGIFHKDEERTENLADEQLLQPGSIIEKVKIFKEEHHVMNKSLLLGCDFLGSNEEFNVVPFDQCYPRASWGGALALQNLRDDCLIEPAFLLPKYIQRPAVEEKHLFYS